MKKTTKTGAKAPKVKIKRFEKRVVPCKHVYSQTETIEIKDEMVAKMSTHAEVELQMKSITADYKARPKVLATEVDQLHGKLRDGYEMRERECLVYFHTASNDKGKPVKKDGMKRIVMADTKAWVRDESMSPSDFQSEMFERDRLERESKAAKSKAVPAGEKLLNAPEIPEKEGESASTASTA